MMDKSPARDRGASFFCRVPPTSRAGAQLARSRRGTVAGGATPDLSATREYASRFHNGEHTP